MITQTTKAPYEELQGARRKPYRVTATVVGVLLILCTVASILSVAPLGSLLDTPVNLADLAANDNAVVLAALIEFVAAATGAGIGIALYPVHRQHGPAMAFGAAAARVVAAALVLVGTLSLLALLTVAQEWGSASPAGAGTDASVQALLAVRDWGANFMISLPFLLGAGLYYYLMYRNSIVPRWLSVWGLLAVALSFAATLYSGFTQDFGFSTGSTALNAPIALQEMVVAVWLIAKGFNLERESSPAQNRP